MSLIELYDLFIHHPKVTTDSRNCPEESIFFALKGDHFDGNQYAQKALSVGCAYAVIDNPDYYIGERTILVDNALETLQKLAQRHRKTLGIPVIGITGTNGKTTTKELMAAVLTTTFKVLYTEGNLNNHIGVPLTLLRLNRAHELAIVEMGASKPGDIKELVEMAMPNYGIITNVGEAHLEGFGSLEGVIQTKGELYDYIRRTKGALFIRKEDQTLQGIARGIQQISYGATDDAFAWGHVVDGAPCVAFEWKQQGKVHQVETHLVGAYNIDNILAAVAVGRYFKVPSERINRAIAGYEPTNNRSQLKQTEHNQLIIDAYNANPSSMKVALQHFASMQASPKAVILADMCELGVNSKALHAQVVEQIKACRFDKVYLCGNYFTQTGDGLNTFPTIDKLVASLTQHPLQGYHILIKGSRSMTIEKTIDVL